MLALDRFCVIGVEWAPCWNMQT